MATNADCAAHLILSERRFRELLDEGIVDRKGVGAYDLNAVREQYILHLRAVASGRSGKDGDADLSSARVRLAQGQAEALEMRNAASRAELLTKADVHAAVTGAFLRVRAKLLALPSKIAPLVSGFDSIAEIRDIITNAIHEALSELAATQVAGVPLPSGGDAGAERGAGLVEGAEPAAEPVHQPVGRSRTAPQPRGERGARKVGHKPG